MSDQTINNPADIIEEPAAEPPVEPPKPDPQESEPAIDVEQLQKEVEDARKAREKAEKALEHTKSENAKYKAEMRKQMTAEEQNAAKEAELAEKEADLARRVNRTAAREALAALQLTEKELTEEDLGLFVCADEATTTARCQFINDLVQRRVALARKDERDKIQQEMPKPPAGEAEQADDPFLAGFNAGYGKK